MRQVCIEGKVEKVGKEKSEEYFFSRPRGSRLVTWTSRQDQVIDSHAALEHTYRKREEEFIGKKIPLPPYWGGFRLLPTRFEFWQGGKDRLHDRFQYLWEEEQWKIQRLSP